MMMIRLMSFVARFYRTLGVVWCSECEPDVFPVMIDTTAAAINSHSRMEGSVMM